MIKLSELNALFPDEDACKLFLFEHRWPDGVECPRCSNKKVYRLSHKPWHWQCQNRDCDSEKPGKNRGYRFSLITGTVFENTKYPLTTWFMVAFMMLHSKKGMNALQIKRMVFHEKASYETVWYMCTRIRAAMNNEEFSALMGIVEVDETYIGDRMRTGIAQRRRSAVGPKHKIPVVGAISQKGNIVCQIIEDTSALTMNKFVRKAVSEKVDLVATD
jgi:hypothetical protein